jgi:hypothetical protein
VGDRQVVHDGDDAERIGMLVEQIKGFGEVAARLVEPTQVEVDPAEIADRQRFVGAGDGDNQCRTVHRQRVAVPGLLLQIRGEQD